MLIMVMDYFICRSLITSPHELGKLKAHRLIGGGVGWGWGSAYQNDLISNSEQVCSLVPAIYSVCLPISLHTWISWILHCLNDYLSFYFLSVILDLQMTVLHNTDSSWSSNHQTWTTWDWLLPIIPITIWHQKFVEKITIWIFKDKHFQCWGYFSPKHKDAKIFGNPLNPVMLVFII